MKKLLFILIIIMGCTEVQQPNAARVRVKKLYRLKAVKKDSTSVIIGQFK